MLASNASTLARLKVGLALAQRQADLPQAETKAQATTADFLSGTQDAVIVADLQSRVRTLAMAHNVELNSSNTLPPRKNNKLPFIGLRVVMRGQLQDIQNVIHGIESSVPLLFVERFVVRVDTWPIKSTDPNVDGAPALVAEIDIFGAKVPTITGMADLSNSTAALPASPAEPPGAAASPNAPQPIRGGRRS